MTSCLLYKKHRVFAYFNSSCNTAELKRIWDEHELTEAESEHPFEYYFPIRGIYDYSTGGTLAAIRDYPKGLDVNCAP